MHKKTLQTDYGVFLTIVVYLRDGRKETSSISNQYI